jgi:hypothetical protein
MFAKRLQIVCKLWSIHSDNNTINNIYTKYYQTIFDLK